MLLHLPLEDFIIALVCLAGTPFFSYQQTSDYKIHDEVLRETGRHYSIRRQNIYSICLQHDICVFRQRKL